MRFLRLLSLLPLFSLSVFGQDRDAASIPPGAPLVPVESMLRMAGLDQSQLPLRTNTHNFAIIESQSTMSAHNMDVQWLGVVTGMGHTGTIRPQTFLDDTLFFGTTDALIISSGIIALTPTRVTTIRKFLQAGKPVYLQGEYLPTYSTNIAFRDITIALGGTFTLGSTVAGDLIPCIILNNYATTPNAVPSIGYHWYGCTGSGCNNVEYFMRYGGSNLGFVFCPMNPAYGDLIQNTDQDWVRVGTSLPLMRNIVTAMLSGNACSVVCGTLLEADQLLVNATQQENGTIELMWSLEGPFEEGSFTVECNGMQIGEMSLSDPSISSFMFLDRRLPSGTCKYVVRQFDTDGTEIRSGEIALELPSQPTRLTATSTPDGIRVWLSEGSDLKSLWLMDMAGRRMPLATEDLHSAEGLLIPAALAPRGVLLLQGLTTEGQQVVTRLVH